VSIIRPYEEHDWPDCLRLIRETFKAGDTYPYPGDMPDEAIRELWINAPAATFVSQDSDGKITGTYYIKANQQGRGSHVCNCGYIVDIQVRGQGIAGSMCEHSQKEAIKLGFTAMQYNLVVATNTGAVRLWQRHGFEIIGTLPGVFRHQTLGLVDAHVMFKKLA